MKQTEIKVGRTYVKGKTERLVLEISTRHRPKSEKVIKGVLFLCNGVRGKLSLAEFAKWADDEKKEK